MKNIRSMTCGLVVLAASAILPGLPGHAAPQPDESTKQIPEVLKPWESWATWNDKHRLCPNPYSDPAKHLCFWPSRFDLQAKHAGGEFDLVVTVFHETWVPLPGDQEVWPLDVRADGAPLATIEHDENPAVRLNAGTFHLTGVFRWNDVPQRIRIPREIGILALTLDDAPVESPEWDATGFLWLKRTGAAEEADKNAAPPHEAS